MNYLEAKTFIEYTNTFGIRPGLDIVKELLSRLDNPQDKLNVIHIAGTNGKGSICAYLEYGLRECELKIARYISPTLFSYLERFQINGKYISEEKFSEITYRVKCICDEMVSDGLYHPTSFEIETAIAFLWFLDEEVDIVLLETGMGGKEDATNVVAMPLATVFATISFDHMQFLGNTIEDIAKVKSGIMREGVPVIASKMPEVTKDGITNSAKETLINEANKIGAPIYFAEDLDSIDIENPLQGVFQQINLTTALLTFDIIGGKIQEINSNKPIKKEVFISGIKKAKWPGRYETIATNPIIIRDGAHNEDAVKSLCETIQKDKRINGKVHLIMGCYKDKDYVNELKIILPLAKSFSAVTAPNPLRAYNAKDLYETAVTTAKEIGLCIPATYKDNIKQAVEDIVSDCEYDGSSIVIFGSLSLAGETEIIRQSGELIKCRTS